MRKIYLAFAWLAFVVTSQAQIRMTSVNPANHQIGIKNFGMMDVDVSTYRFCALFNYQTLNQSPVTIVSGDFNLSSDESVTVSWDNTGGAGFLSNVSDVGLYLPSVTNFSSAANMVDFMQYGAGGQGRENVAVAGGRACRLDAEGDNSSGFRRLGPALFRQINVGPSREKVLEIPIALPVANQGQCSCSKVAQRFCSKEGGDHQQD